MNIVETYLDHEPLAYGALVGVVVLIRCFVQSEMTFTASHETLLHHLLVIILGDPS